MGIAHRGINLLLNHTGLEKSISELKGTWQVGGNWETSIARRERVKKAKVAEMGQEESIC